MNISSAIVHAQPGAAGIVRTEIEAVAGVEVHAANDDKLIVTIEADTDRSTTDIFESLSRIGKVMSVSMVYHRTEDDPEGYLAQV